MQMKKPLPHINAQNHENEDSADAEKELDALLKRFDELKRNR
jgi:hypothetical protein